MKILPVKSFNPCFKGAKANISAFSDTHGNLKYTDSACNVLTEDDMFLPEDKSNINIMAVCGDWFTDGGRMGYKSFPGLKLGQMQAVMYNYLVDSVKRHAKNTVTLFTPGNHEFDDGIKSADELLSQLDSDIILTNTDLSVPDNFSECKKSNNIVNQKIIEIPDDKNPDKKHKMLFLGVMPVNMSYYQKQSVKIPMPDNLKKSQHSIQRYEYDKTIEDCKNRIKEFKDENPDGFVVLMSHTGVKFADCIAEESDLDLILNGHEHEKSIRYVNNTPIVEMSMNFENIYNIKIKFDDDGKASIYKVATKHPLEEDTEEGRLSYIYKELFKEDIKPQYSLKTDKSGIYELGIKDIRKGNNYLAGFITDSVLQELKNKGENVDVFALNASSIRYNLPVSDEKSISRADIMNVLAGIKNEDGKIMTTEVTGKDIAYMVADNYLFNKKMPEKNPVIHYSGIKVDRTGMFKAMKDNASLSELTKYIIDVKTGESILPDKTYVIANPVKYFNKSPNNKIKNMKNDSKMTSYTVQDLFMSHFENSKGPLNAKCDVRIY